jgi:tetratricopeptide (TPR) repeat protein
LAQDLSNLGFLVSAAHAEEALPMLNRSRRLLETLAGDDPASAEYAEQLAVTLGVLGSVHLRLQAPDQAIEAFQHEHQSLTQLGLLRGRRYVLRDEAINRNNLGRASHQGRRIPEAEIAFGQALDAIAMLQESRPLDPTDQSSLAGVHHNLANLCEEQRQWRQAAEHYEQAIRLQQGVAVKLPQNRRIQELLAQHHRGAARVQRRLQGEHGDNEHGDNEHGDSMTAADRPAATSESRNRPGDSVPWKPIAAEATR